MKERLEKEKECEICALTRSPRIEIIITAEIAKRKGVSVSIQDNSNAAWRPSILCIQYDSSTLPFGFPENQAPSSNNSVEGWHHSVVCEVKIVEIQMLLISPNLFESDIFALIRTDQTV